MTRWISHHAEVLTALAAMPDDTFDGGLSDVPYGFGPNQPTLKELIAYLGGADLDTGGDFLGADWHVPSVQTWRELYRVLKPGAFFMSFAGPRTSDLVSLGMRAAGFEIRDVITFAWVFGQGFPKSQDASKAVDAEAGAEREVVGARRFIDGYERTTARTRSVAMGTPNASSKQTPITAPATDRAKDWDGFGTALKPAFEPIILARKPLIGTLAENIRVHGTGALAIDASRIATDWSERSEAWKRSGHSAKPTAEKIAAPPGNGIECHPDGRWPANLILDEATAEMLDEQAGTNRRGEMPARRAGIGFGSSAIGTSGQRLVFEPGGPSRFFYVAKASRRERELGCEGLPFREAPDDEADDVGEIPKTGAARNPRSLARNYHPNVKPIDFVRYIARLTLPPPRRDPRRIVIPYAGSGSEMIGAILAGWDEVVGIEREPRKPGDPDYQAILRARVELAIANPRAFESYAERKAEKPLQGPRSLFGEDA